MTTGFRNGSIYVDDAPSSRVNLAIPESLINNYNTFLQNPSTSTGGGSAGTLTKFIPVISDGTNAFTMTRQTGSYIKNYGITYFNIDIAWNSKGKAALSAALMLSLPSAPNGSFVCNMAKNDSVGPYYGSLIISAATVSGAPCIIFYRGSTPILISDTANTGNIIVSGFYF